MKEKVTLLKANEKLTVNMRLPLDLIRKLRIMKGEKDIQISKQVSLALEDYFKKMENERHDA